MPGLTNALLGKVEGHERNQLNQSFLMIIEPTQVLSNSHFGIVGRNKPACEGSEVIEKIGGGRFRHSVTREKRSLPQPYNRHQRPK